VSNGKNFGGVYQGAECVVLCLLSAQNFKQIVIKLG
jgi:hypothetical protein